MSHVKQTFSRQAPWAAFGVVLLITSTGCGKVPEPVAAPLTPAIQIAEKTSITGHITLKGADAAKLTQKIDVGGNPFCTSHGDIIDSTWKVAADGSLADVVITVNGSQRASNLPTTSTLIDQTHCEFVPHTLAIQPGQTVRFHNSDLTFHNIRIARHELGTRSGGENLANLAQASHGDENVRVFDSPGIYRLECDVHRWMRAWIVVHEGIHTAVSDVKGVYEINRALADGDYTVQAFHPQFPKPLSKQITVREGVATADFVFDFTHSLTL